MRRRLGAAVLAFGIALVGASCGGGGGDDGSSVGSGSGAAGRTVEVEMVDVGYEPARITVDPGETVRFVFTNTGKVRHEAYFGTPDDQDEHAEAMRDARGGDGHGAHGDGDDDNPKVTVEPGGSEEIEVTFPEGGAYEIGCHEPGHYKAGMKIDVDVR